MNFFFFEINLILIDFSPLPRVIRWPTFWCTTLWTWSTWQAVSVNNVFFPFRLSGSILDGVDKEITLKKVFSHCFQNTWNIYSFFLAIGWDRYRRRSWFLSQKYLKTYKIKAIQWDFFLRFGKMLFFAILYKRFDIAALSNFIFL